MVSVAVRRPAGSAVGLTGHTHAHVGDLRRRPPLGGSGSRTDGGKPGEGGCGGAAEGQLTVLSHPGLQVGPHALSLKALLLCQHMENPVSGYTHTAWKSRQTLDSRAEMIIQLKALNTCKFNSSIFGLFGLFFLDD